LSRVLPAIFSDFLIFLDICEENVTNMVLRDYPGEIKEEVKVRI
jgi:hypothetical protein